MRTRRRSGRLSGRSKQPGGERDHAATARARRSSGNRTGASGGRRRAASRGARSASTRSARSATRKRAGQKWSGGVMRSSNALDLESGVFTRRSPRQIALSLKRSAEASHRRKSEPFRSAMSMLNFHINRGGRGLTVERRRVLAQAKD